MGPADVWILSAMLFSSISLPPVAATGAGYSMYVWTDSFDSTVCGETEFNTWDTSDSTCFTHSWDTACRRQWLWDTCNLGNREISTIYLSGVHSYVEAAYTGNSCNVAGIDLIKETLAEGHSSVAGLKIYALYAVSDEAVSEQNKVKHVVYYNDNCAGSVAERFDGFAVNNEAYTDFKCDAGTSRQTAYLSNLDVIRTEAAKQQAGSLLTHFSVSWHWGTCSDAKKLLTWNAKSADAVEHMIDIFDSVDVQVGYTTISAVKSRMITAGMEYAQTESKPIFTTLYTNKASPCQITFFPDATCSIGVHTQAGMYDVIDLFAANDLGYAKPCIHYFRGIYSSGGNSDWPVLSTACASTTTTTTTTSTTSGPVSTTPSSEAASFKQWPSYMYLQFASLLAACLCFIHRC